VDILIQKKLCILFSIVWKSSKSFIFDNFRKDDLEVSIRVFCLIKYTEKEIFFDKDEGTFFLIINTTDAVGFLNQNISF